MTEMPQVHVGTQHGAVEKQKLPGLFAASVTRSSVELKSFFRGWQSMVFTMALPVLTMVVFSAVFTSKVPGTDVDYRLLFIAGIIATGVMSTSFQSLAISVALDREEGVIRRMASSPMPRGAYFVGIMVKAIVTTIVEVIILMVLGVLLYKLPIPSDGERWLTLVWVVLLGVASCSLAGIAYTALIPNARSAAAIATPPFMILQFISGVFFPLMMIPAVLRYVAYAFPLLWMAKGLRYVFLPDSLSSAEPGGVWDLGLVATILVIWTIGGGILAALVFRWRGQRVK
ncbi:MAG: ABC transporter permease [Arachnia propionica]|uniref:ABC transporter permease n=1 Tax=Arachnia propionica TaxID=1750 RepID=UPI0026FC77D9|nr:ABC transporter permease [Arachnia propionica]